MLALQATNTGETLNTGPGTQGNFGTFMQKSPRP